MKIHSPRFDLWATGPMCAGAPDVSICFIWTQPIRDGLFTSAGSSATGHSTW